ncbi:Fur-regulated protein, partial [Klebsiella pneumoniae]
MLYALFYRGALLSGDLPSKSGAAELRELGFAETRRTVTEYQKENHFTFLTAEGQEFAVNHLANTQFGNGFKIDRSGKVFINDAFIGGEIYASELEAPQSVTNIYNISFGVRNDKPVQNKVTISADKFEVKSDIYSNLEVVLENTLKKAAKSAAMDVVKQVAADQKALDELADHIRKAIHNECLA